MRRGGIRSTTWPCRSSRRRVRRRSGCCCEFQGRKRRRAGTPRARNGRMVLAADLIDEGHLVETGLPELAATLGVTDRHLRRVFQEEFGVAPIEYAQTQRLLLGKRLLTDTQMPVIEVAFSSGFSSLRRFNHLF